MSDLRSVIAVAILAGGNSRRMGEDKAALVEAHQSLISHQVLDLRRVLPALPVFVCAGSRRYPELLPHGIHYVSDKVDDAGPLAGIAEALKAAKALNGGDGYVLVMPTDSLIPPSQIHRLLVDTATESADVVLLKGRRLHPLHGLFSTQLAPSMERYLIAGGRAVMGFLDNERWQTALAPDDWEPCLNFNTPEEYTHARSALAETTVV
ncbi:molybdenum cofactor guanylyltransferase [Candidatus Paraluminiphilus aquimaris]|uniref:Molybdenum cofactor guanylyltransferase n=1 Tax=Candidatus Paraluminiphilus aquimaris TaxID=2518994 RepID=A0ABY6Q6D6_9GAMM|nr:molybdenum cofactor guanylyltransferase [Candidatus Paraluminiphilus aquimaris]UZP74436.1 molybdenum cofactor guanylyltransferase [Candidatus Paraluminiphilus aquimaris]